MWPSKLNTFGAIARAIPLASGAIAWHESVAAFIACALSRRRPAHADRVGRRVGARHVRAATPFCNFSILTLSLGPCRMPSVSRGRWGMPGCKRKNAILGLLACVGVMACVGLMAPGAAHAENPLKGLMLLKGRCMRLVIRGQDATRICNPALMNTEYADGRTGFYFTAQKDTVVTFSGMGPEQITLRAGTIVQPIDMIITNIAGRVDKVRAVGRCRFGNPYKGSALIACEADTANGSYVGTFATDGSAPIMKNF